MKLQSYTSLFLWSKEGKAMNILVVDVGGTHVKVLATGKDTPRKIVSGPNLTPAKMVSGVKDLTSEWQYDAVTIGYPGPVVRGKIAVEPHNLGPGWMGFDFEGAFGRPVRLINDAAMQALGGYEGGRMLFIGLGTGLGSALILDGIVQPTELAHLPYRKGTFEDYVGLRGLKRLGKKKWRNCVNDVIARLIAALEPEYVVLGGGNLKELKELPPSCRAGTNAAAFRGGFRLWDQPTSATPVSLAPVSAAVTGQSWFLQDHGYFVTRLQPRQSSGLHHYISPLTRRGESSDLTGLISQVIQIEPELLQGFWNDDLDIDPVIVSRLFLNSRRNRKGGFHNLSLFYVRNTVLSWIPNSLI
jgi:polyphosphate glucokinase